MKKCTRCKHDKSLDSFFNDRNTSDGKSPACKSCVYKRRLEPKKEKPPAGFKKCNGCGIIKSYDKFYSDKANKTDGRYSHCKECKTISTYAWREKNKDHYNEYMRKVNKERYPNSRLVRYGKTKEWFEKTLSDQNNTCAICCKVNTSSKRTFAVDHNHESGKVRGILCYNCNRLLHAFDNKKLYKKILEYLARYDSYN